MKKLIVLLALLLAFLCFMSSCSSSTIVHARTPAKSVPPGQAKKISGSQSAKQYAPGQQKKQTTPAKTSKSTSSKSASVNK